MPVVKIEHFTDLLRFYSVSQSFNTFKKTCTVKALMGELLWSDPCGGGGAEGANTRPPNFKSLRRISAI